MLGVRARVVLGVRARVVLGVKIGVRLSVSLSECPMWCLGSLSHLVELFVRVSIVVVELGVRVFGGCGPIAFVRLGVIRDVLGVSVRACQGDSRVGYSVGRRWLRRCRGWNWCRW